MSKHADKIVAIANRYLRIKSNQSEVDECVAALVAGVDAINTIEEMRQSLDHAQRVIRKHVPRDLLGLSLADEFLHDNIDQAIRKADMIMESGGEGMSLSKMAAVAKKALENREVNTEPMYLLISSGFVRINWESIHKDPDNNRPDIKTADEYILEAKKGSVTAGGAVVVISDRIGGQDADFISIDECDMNNIAKAVEDALLENAGVAVVDHGDAEAFIASLRDSGYEIVPLEPNHQLRKALQSVHDKMISAAADKELCDERV